jgi:flagellin
MMSNTTAAGKSMEKLSSGLRINKAGDDAAGLAISEKMRGQIRGLDQASRNAQDGISMIQTAEGGLNETHSILQRMRELAVQAGNDTNTTVDRGEIQKEMNQLTSEINRIGNTTEFNTQKLLNGNKTGAQTAAVTAAVAGVYTVGTLTDTTGTSTLTLDGVALATTTSGTATALMTSFKAAASSNAGLSAKYTFATSGAVLKITQKSGQESSSVPTAVGATVATTTSGKAKADAIDGKATLQIGANEGQKFEIDILDMRSKSLKLSSTTAGTNFTSGTANALTDKSGTASEYGLDVSTYAKATAAVTTINDAIASVSAERSKLGAYQNRLEHTINNLNTSSENLTSAESRVRDVDMAKEMMAFSKNNILSQAAQAMVAQAKSQPEGVLQLLR